MENKIWIAEVKWNDDTTEFFGPFTKYDSGFKVWSAKFSYNNKGKFQWINCHILNQNI